MSVNEGIGDDKALLSSPLCPSSFTAINSPSSAQPCSNQPNARDVSTARRRQHNPAVAEYLGLDVEMEVRPVKPSFSPSFRVSGQPPKRTRQRVAGCSNRCSPAKSSRKDVTERATILKTNEQRHVFDEISAAQLVQSVTPKTSSKDLFTEQGCNTSPSKKWKSPGELHQSRTDDQAAPTHRAYNSETSLETQPPEAATAQHQASIQDANVHRPARDIHSPKQEVRASPPPAAHSEGHLEESLLDDGIDDADLLILAEDIENITRGNTSTADVSDSALSDRSVRDIQCTSSRPSNRFVSPATVRTQRPSPSLDMKPIVRSPFPTQVRDRSPILGLTSDCVLRTCFRVGEALNAGRNAMRHGKSVLIELYARVLSSTRDEAKQQFVLCDLFHSKPPYLQAEYDAAIWRSVPLHDFDSRAFLVNTRDTEKKRCRCILTVKKNGNKEGWATMLNIWPAKKEDILWVQGIVDA